MPSPQTLVPITQVMPPCAYRHLPASSFNTKFVHVSQNKVRCAINVVLWTPEGRRCMTGTASGEFTLWSGNTFSFESILQAILYPYAAPTSAAIQAHEFAIRAMRFSHNEHYLVSGDDSGRIKYWKPNLELLTDEAAHREAVRGICFAPSDLKFCTCSDDATLKLWDFRNCEVNSVLSGHGADVKCVDWHPVKALIASGSKDAQIKLWTPKDQKCVSTLYGHKSGINQIWWNRNGNWLLSCSRDQVCKVYDIRVGKELETYRGHTREVMCCQWHPFHEELFVSGGSDGSLIYWLVHHKSPQAKLSNAHDTTIWSVSWHPMGHLLASGSSDYVTKFWCRPRPGEMWRDRHFQEFGDAQETGSLPQNAAESTVNEKVVIPGIEDVSASRKLLPVAGKMAWTALRADSLYKNQGQKFDLNISGGGATQFIDSEMSAQADVDDPVMGSSLDRADQRTMQSPNTARSKFGSSFRIPRNPSRDSGY